MWSRSGARRTPRSTRRFGATVSGGTTRRGFLQASAAAVLAGQRADRPNVILVIVDSLRADAVYGNHIRTPTMDSLVRQGLHFTSVYPEAMPTVPARNSILGGRRAFPFRHWHDYPGLIEQPGWAPLTHVDQAFTTAFRRAGYWTAYVTDNPFLGFAAPYEPVRRSVHRFMRTGGEIGGSNPASRVPRKVLRHWLYPPLRDAKTTRRIGLYIANSGYYDDPNKSFAARVFRNALEALDEAAFHQPFMLVVDTYQPHEPWTPPPQYLDLYGDRRWRGPEPATLRYDRTANWLRPRERGPVLRRLRALYAASVTMTDDWLGVLLARVRALGLERKTAIVLVADHGILFGEHGWTGKIQSALYPALIRVPLILVDPRRRLAGRRSSWFASTHDVGPTLLGMAGVKPPPMMTGVDLSRLFRGHKLPHRPYAYGGYMDSFFIRSRRWAMWGYTKPADFRLFDLKHDPGQYHDVAHHHRGVAKALYHEVLERAGGRLPFYP